MKAVLIWSGLSAAILLTALLMSFIPVAFKGMALMGALFLTTAGLMVKINQGSK